MLLAHYLRNINWYFHSCYVLIFCCEYNKAVGSIFTQINLVACIYMYYRNRVHRESEYGLLFGRHLAERKLYNKNSSETQMFNFISICLINCPKKVRYKRK